MVSLGWQKERSQHHLFPYRLVEELLQFYMVYKLDEDKHLRGDLKVFSMVKKEYCTWLQEDLENFLLINTQKTLFLKQWILNKKVFLLVNTETEQLHWVTNDLHSTKPFSYHF